MLGEPVSRGNVDGQMSRRRLLQIAGLTAASLVLAGCGPQPGEVVRVDNDYSPHRAYELQPTPEGDAMVIFDPELVNHPDRGLAGVTFKFDRGYQGDPLRSSIAMAPSLDSASRPTSLRIISEEVKPNPAFLVDKEFPIAPDGTILGSDGKPRTTFYPIIGLGNGNQEVVYVGPTSYRGARAYLLEPTLDSRGTLDGLTGWRLEPDRTFPTPPIITQRPS